MQIEIFKNRYNSDEVMIKTVRLLQTCHRAEGAFTNPAHTLNAVGPKLGNTTTQTGSRFKKRTGTDDDDRRTRRKVVPAKDRCSESGFVHFRHQQSNSAAQIERTK